MVTISQNDVAPPSTTSRCVPHPSGFPVQMRHGDGYLGAWNVDGADRFVGAGSEGRGADQSAGAKSATVSSSRETGHPHFPERWAVACRYVRPKARARKIRQPTAAGWQPADGAQNRRGGSVAV